MISIHFALLNWFFISCLNSTLNVRHLCTVKLVLQIQIRIDFIWCNVFYSLQWNADYMLVLAFIPFADILQKRLKPSEYQNPIHYLLSLFTDVGSVFPNFYTPTWFWSPSASSVLLTPAVFWDKSSAIYSSCQVRIKIPSDVENHKLCQF